MTKPKNKNKNYCSKCHEKTLPTYSKKCQMNANKSIDKPSTSVQPVTSSSDSDSDVWDSGVGAFKVNMGARKKVTKQQDRTAQIRGF